MKIRKIATLAIPSSMIQRSFCIIPMCFYCFIAKRTKKNVLPFLFFQNVRAECAPFLMQHALVRLIDDPWVARREKTMEGSHFFSTAWQRQRTRLESMRCDAAWKCQAASSKKNHRPRTLIIRCLPNQRSNWLVLNWHLGVIFCLHI